MNAIRHLGKRIMKLFCVAAITASMCVSGASALYSATITGSNVNFRAAPGGSVITTLSKDTQIAVVGNSGEFYQIAYNGMTGYVSGEYVKGTAEQDVDFAVGTGTVTCETTVNVRATPSTEAEVLTTAENGALIWVGGIANGWYKVTINDVTGYMAADYITFASRGSQMTSREQSGSAAELRQQVISYAATFLGTPYVYGGSSPSGFDCSGFTSYVYKNTVRSIPRTATAQRNATTNVAMDELLPGDLVFFGSDGRITHVGIYVGGGDFIHSPRTGYSIKYDTLWSGNYNRRFVCGGRVIFD